MASNRALSERFFAALTAGDSETLRAVCAPDIEVAMNRSPPFGLNTLISVISSIGDVMADYRYENIVYSETVDGFVHERDSLGTLGDGTRAVVRACVVATVEDGMITGFREYFDSVDAAPMLGAQTPESGA